jgi:hypothetical protein
LSDDVATKVQVLGLEGSESEMKLRLALGVAVFNARGTAPTMASAPARALAIAEKIGATSFQLRALWQLARERAWLFCAPTPWESFPPCYVLFAMSTNSLRLEDLRSDVDCGPNSVGWVKITGFL